jgi:hypothetical protein
MTVAAYRDRYGITDDSSLGPEPENAAQRIDAARARSALARVNEAARRSAAVTERCSIERTSPGRSL